MGYKLKKPFTKNRASDESVATNVRPSPPRLPSFKESLYEDAIQGAYPAEGLLPLRGNKSFAVRIENPNDSYRPGGSSTTSQESFTGQERSTMASQLRPGASDSGIQSSEPEHTNDRNFDTSDMRYSNIDPREYWKGGQLHDNYGEGDKRKTVLAADPNLRRPRRSDAIGSTEERAGDCSSPQSFPELESPQRSTPLRPRRSALASSPTQSKSVRFSDDTPARNADVSESSPPNDQLPPPGRSASIARTVGSSRPIDQRIDRPVQQVKSSSQIPPQSWATAGGRAGATAAKSDEVESLPRTDAFPLAPVNNQSFAYRPARQAQRRQDVDYHTASPTAALNDGQINHLARVPVPGSRAETRDSVTSSSLSDTSVKPDSHSMSSIEPPPRASSRGKSNSEPIDTIGLDSSSDVPSEEVIRRSKYNSAETTVHESIRPAVTHEYVTKKIHEIREERVFREIHHYDIYHRILPITDVEVLPARHYKVEDGKLVEMRAEEVPPHRNSNWVVAETVSTGKTTTQPRRFTAREFPGEEGDERTYITPQGHPRTDTTWIHPPQLEPGGQQTGQTTPYQI